MCPYHVTKANLTSLVEHLFSKSMHSPLKRTNGKPLAIWAEEIRTRDCQFSQAWKLHCRLSASLFTRDYLKVR